MGTSKEFRKMQARRSKSMKAMGKGLRKAFPKAPRMRRTKGKGCGCPCSVLLLALAALPLIAAWGILR